MESYISFWLIPIPSLSPCLSIVVVLFCPVFSTSLLYCLPSAHRTDLDRQVVLHWECQRMGRIEDRQWRRQKLGSGGFAQALNYVQHVSGFKQGAVSRLCIHQASGKALDQSSPQQFPSLFFKGRCIYSCLDAQETPMSPKPINAF